MLAAGGYPESYSKGKIISGLNQCDTNHCKTFHAGTAIHGEEIATSGGRVLCVTALGNTVSEAQNLAYKSVEKISWENMYYRNDIGYRAVAREQS